MSEEQKQARKCRWCGRTNSIERFRKDSHMCLECVIAASKEYLDENREHKNKKSYEYGQKHRQRLNEHAREYYNRPEIKEHYYQYRQRPEVKEQRRKNKRKSLQRPEVKQRTKARHKEYRQRPEVKAHRKQYIQRPEIKERSKQLRDRPEAKEKAAQYRQRPEVRIRERKRQREYGKRPYVKEKLRVKSHNRYARKKSLPDTLTADEWQHSLNYFNGCCAICGRQLNDMFGEFTAAIDHWIPLSYKGDENPGTVATNIVPLCNGVGGCNNHKCNIMPDVWLKRKFGTRKANKIMKRIQDYFDSLA